MADFHWRRMGWNEKPGQDLRCTKLPLPRPFGGRVAAVAVLAATLGLAGCVKSAPSAESAQPAGHEAATTAPAAPGTVTVSAKAPVAPGPASKPAPAPSVQPQEAEHVGGGMHHGGAPRGSAEAHQAMMKAASGKPSGAPGGAAWPALARMDPRTPVPLQPMMAWHQKQNMMQHLVAIQQVSEALSVEDWAAVEKAAKSIGYSDSMATMCRHMGAGAKGFTDLALTFHRRADTIADAARKHDTKAVLKATAHTLKACTTCHATYRQDVVDAPTWQQRTKP